MVGGCNGLQTTSVGVSGRDSILAKEGMPIVLGDCRGEAKKESVSTEGDLGDIEEGRSVGGRIASGDESGL